MYDSTCQETPTGYGYRPCIDPVCPRCHPPLSPHQQATADLTALHARQWKERDRMIHPELYRHEHYKQLKLF